jgi:hypothetical protein
MNCKVNHPFLEEFLLFLMIFSLIKTVELLLPRRDGRAVECGGLENR